jgi:hypothetical protein
LASLLLGLLGVAHGFGLQSASAPRPSDAARIQTEIARLEQNIPKVPDRGAGLFLLAKEYVQLGEREKALSLLKQCISLDEGFDPSGSVILAPLRSSPEFQQLIGEVRVHRPPVQRARVAFTFPEKDLFPEGLAVDPDRHIFYMGSMHRKKIVMRDAEGEVSDFVKPGLYNLLGLGGIKIDPADHSVWAASDNDHDSELLHFDAQGKLLERYSPPGAGPHVLNDLVLRGERDLYVTDTLAQQVYRFDRRIHNFSPMSLPRSLFGPNGIAITADENLLYIADLMGVIQVDLRTNSAVNVDPGEHNTLAGNDGLYWYKGSLLGLQYGTGAFRAMRWRLSPDGRRVVSSEVLEYRSRLMTDPTTGAVYHDQFYFIANTGIDNLNDDKIVDVKKLEPVHIAVVPLN